MAYQRAMAYKRSSLNSTEFNIIQPSKSLSSSQITVDEFCRNNVGFFGPVEKPPKPLGEPAWTRWENGIWRRNWCLPGLVWLPVEHARSGSCKKRRNWRASLEDDQYHTLSKDGKGLSSWFYWIERSTKMSCPLVDKTQQKTEVSADPGPQ